MGVGGSAGNDEGGTRKMMWVCFDLLTFLPALGLFSTTLRYFVVGMGCCFL